MAQSNLDDRKIDFLRFRSLPDKYPDSCLVAGAVEVVRNSRLAPTGENRMAERRIRGAGVEGPAKRIRSQAEVVPSFPLAVEVAHPDPED